MSAKYFCDQCGKYLVKRDYNRLKRKYKNISVEVMVAVGSTWNGGHSCHRCVIETVNKGKPTK